MELKPEFLRKLEAIVGGRGIVSSREGRLTYEADMHTFYKGAPDVVVLPETALQVARVVELCWREHVPVVPRGSGTGIIGGAMAPLGGVMVAMNRMNRILELDLANPATTSPLTHRARWSPPSAATARRMPAARIASSTASR